MATTIRILYLIDEIESAEAGGTERQILQMIRHLRDAGFQPELCVLRGTDWLTEADAGCPVRLCHVRRLRSLRGAAELWRLRTWMKKRGFDVVQTFFPESNLIGPILSRLAGVPIVLGSRRNMNYWMSSQFAAAQRLANRFVTRLVANSEAVRDLVVRMEGIPASKVDVLYNGIDVERFRPSVERRAQTRSSLGLTEADQLIGNVASLRPVKGVLLFVSAAIQVAREFRAAHFLLVGEGPQRAEIEAMIRGSGFAPRFYLAGRQADVAPYLNACDIAVLSSESEGLSNSVLEYMAAGLPCVVTDVGGNREALGNDGAEFVPYGDANALATAISSLLRDPERRAKFSQAGRERANRLFSASETGKKLADYYRRMTSQRRVP